ncbi:GNAT family N-acetyltransferase [Microcoleus vaginatus GB1-A2]|uniref:GNAT family N-acetyltransferase n=1 Tax=Microcoleus vaginatus TaxID=119532 RepID=UPI0032A4F3FE
MANLDIKIREAELADLKLIVDFISQKSEFDGCKNLLTATADKLQQTLFCQPPLVRVLLAEVAGTAVGFALFYSSYSSLLTQPCLWLDDLFVQATMRGRGVGTALLKYLAQIAESTNCGRMEWTVNTANRLELIFKKSRERVFWKILGFAVLMGMQLICWLANNLITNRVFVSETRFLREIGLVTRNIGRNRVSSYPCVSHINV